MPVSASRRPLLLVAAIFAFTSFGVVEYHGVVSTTLVTEANAGTKFRNNRSKGKFRNGQRFRNSGVRLGARRGDRRFIQRKGDIARRNERVVIENQLQSARRSSSVLANPRRSSFSTPLIIDGFGGNNSGVFFRGNRRDRLFIERRNDIARRNERLVIENELQSARRSGAVLANPNTSFGDALVLDPRREGVLSAGVDDNGTAGLVTRNVQPCPKKYNCGYRIYSNGTGPRIITPGVAAGNGLPEFDGISGPVIITPYN
ncbi:MAG: hypothetical protein AAGA76_08475 [Pseudomonadota bacterium]